MFAISAGQGEIRLRWRGETGTVRWLAVERKEYDYLPPPSGPSLFSLFPDLFPQVGSDGVTAQQLVFSNYFLSVGDWEWLDSLVCWVSYIHYQLYVTNIQY